MLYNKIKHINLEDAIKLEYSDRQFLALEKLSKKIDSKYFLSLIIENSLICYQLSWKWEDYWEEFSEKASEYKFEKIEDTITFLKWLIPNSKNNKRFVNIKTKRLEKIENKIKEISDNYEYYYNNMWELRDLLAKIMKQKKDSKTIVFAIKMFWYWARVVFWKNIPYPFEIWIPIDSRLIKLHEIYCSNDENIKLFYDNLSKKMNIPPLHLDPIIWINYDKLINNEKI